MTNWPQQARCAVTMTVHFDAETLWTSKDERNSRRPVTLSQGRFGAARGVDALLGLLESEALRTTFFVPGAVAQRYPEVVGRILSGGHALGHHGYAHERLQPEDSSKEEEFLRRGLEALQSVASVRPRGYAAPGWVFTPDTVDLLAKYGFDYSVNMMDDVHPYVHHVAGGAEIVELPVHWLLDDAPFRLGGTDHAKPVSSGEQMLQIWLEEFRGIYEVGGLFNLTLHPQVSGRPSMVQVLRRLLAELRAYPGVWFATCEQLCDFVQESVDFRQAPASP